MGITPDLRQAVSASRDRTLKVWDLASGALQRTTLVGHGAVAVAITPDGRQAVSASDDGTLKVWDLVSGGVKRTVEGHSGEVTAVAITPDGGQAVSGSSDHTLKVWDLASGSLEGTLRGHAGVVTALAITPDGRQAVSASEDRTLKVWDLATGAVVATFTAEAPLHACAVAPDGRTIVVGDSFGPGPLPGARGVAYAAPTSFNGLTRCGSSQVPILARASTPGRLVLEDVGAVQRGS